LNKSIERIAEEYLQGKEIEDKTSIDTVKEKLYTDLHDSFFCTIPSPLHKLFLGKGVSHIVEYQPRLSSPPPNYNWEECQSKWE
jgi:hypothetical protein